MNGYYVCLSLSILYQLYVLNTIYISGYFFPKTAIELQMLRYEQAGTFVCLNVSHSLNKHMQRKMISPLRYQAVVDRQQKIQPSSRIRVNLLSYDSKPTEIRGQYDWIAENNLDGSSRCSSTSISSSRNMISKLVIDPE